MIGTGAETGQRAKGAALMKGTMKIVLLIMVVAVFAFALTGIASAVAASMSPQEIYDYYAANGTLPAGLSTADLQAFLADAANLQYTDPATLAALEVLVRDVIADRQGGDTDNEFPFTGFEMIAGFGAALALVGGGFTLRRFAKKA
jgi:hypothetical protein